MRILHRPFFAFRQVFNLSLVTSTPAKIRSQKNKLGLGTANGETQLTAINNQLLRLYRDGRPDHTGQ